MTCTVDNCERPVFCRGRCKQHWTRYIRAAALTVLAGCGAPAAVGPTDTPPMTVAVADPPAPTTVAELVSPVTVSIPAVRVNPPTTLTTVAPVGLHGQPFAPEGLSDCDEMMFYAAQWGLPERFRALGWRESNCRNEDVVRTFCCHGYWQLYVSLFQRDHRTGPRLRDECGVFSADDVNSDQPLDKQRQACGARVVLDIQGIDAWAMTA